jgi:hypothetical protein
MTLAVRRRGRGGVTGPADVDVKPEDAKAEEDVAGIAREAERECDEAGGVDGNGEPARDAAREDGRDIETGRGRSVDGGAGAQPKSVAKIEVAEGSAGGVASSLGRGSANADIVDSKDAS